MRLLRSAVDLLAPTTRGDGTLKLRPRAQKILSGPDNRHTASSLRRDGNQSRLKQFLSDRPAQKGGVAAVSLVGQTLKSPDGRMGHSAAFVVASYCHLPSSRMRLLKRPGTCAYRHPRKADECAQHACSYRFQLNRLPYSMRVAVA
jgi:hypothetical protein